MNCVCSPNEFLLVEYCRYLKPYFDMRCWSHLQTYFKVFLLLLRKKRVAEIRPHRLSCVFIKFILFICQIFLATKQQNKLSVLKSSCHLFTTHGEGFTVSWCWTSIREAVKTNFSSFRFDSSGNRTSVLWDWPIGLWCSIVAPSWAVYKDPCNLYITLLKLCIKDYLFSRKSLKLFSECKMFFWFFNCSNSTSIQTWNIFEIFDVNLRIILSRKFEI